MGKHQPGLMLSSRPSKFQPTCLAFECQVHKIAHCLPTSKYLVSKRSVSSSSPQYCAAVSQCQNTLQPNALHLRLKSTELCLVCQHQRHNLAPLAALQMIKLAFELLLTKSGDLDPVYIKGVSEVQHLSIIQQHLSTACNACLTRPLASWAEAVGEPTMRLLRLTSRSCYYCCCCRSYRDRADPPYVTGLCQPHSSSCLRTAALGFRQV